MTPKRPPSFLLMIYGVDSGTVLRSSLIETIRRAGEYRGERTFATALVAAEVDEQEPQRGVDTPGAMLEARAVSGRQLG